jgi:hypothetical protein
MKALEPLTERGNVIEVDVAAHPVHGTLATVSVQATDRTRAEAEIGAALGGFAIVH